MKHRVVLSREARTCIEEQIDWFKSDETHGGEALAEKWLQKLHEALAGLGDKPARHAFAPENGRWQRGLELRQMPFRPWKSGVGWRVIYSVDEPQKMVTVIQIRHERRRWLFEEGSDD